MHRFLRRVLPSVAVATITIALVVAVDPALLGPDDGREEDDPYGPRDQSEMAAECPAPETLGPRVSTMWGPVQVAARIVDGRLCAVRALVWPTGNKTSTGISARAIPILDARAVVDGVELDSVTGATFTSDGYRESLQHLLDSL